jgi:hypothetical protein
MGFNSTANTTTLTAKLTPLGRQRMISTNNGLITTFSLGDSDANYNTALPLTTGQVPSLGGNIGPDSTNSNSTAQNARLKSTLILNASGSVKKSVETQSSTISTELVNIGVTTISGSSIGQLTINRADFNTDSKVNLFYSFGLPLTSSDDALFTGTTFANGGFSDTALSGLAQSQILVFALNNANYGDVLDGKTIRFTLPTTAGTYTLYSTFENKGIQTKVEDGNIRDTSVRTNRFGLNIAMLFSDSIMTPNGGDPTLSWATGYNTVKPFSVNNKRLYNLQTNSNLGLTADTAVGIAYLDKGILVITDPTIVSNYDVVTATGASATFNSVSTNVFQNITCIANRGEFGNSTNTTFSTSDVPRISEIGLYDNLGNLIAVGKTDRHITKNVNEIKVFNVKISL